jgi:aspartate/methionine/tyrosine aminotransferase
MIPEFRLERAFARWEFSAPHLLSPSDCEALTIQELLDLAARPASDLLDLRLGYTESQGDPALRERIAALCGVDAGEVLVVVPEEGILLAALSIVEPGDRVVVQTPCYQSLSEIAAWRGAEVVPWPLVEDAGTWRMDLGHLDALLEPGTRLLLVNAPHNPTGHLPSRQELDAIVALCEERGARLFLDEMYRGLEHDPAARLPCAASLTARAISLGGLSKTYGLPGLRLGWLVTRDEDLRRRLGRWKDYTTICAPAPSERLATLALEHGERLVERNRPIVLENLERARALAERWPDVLAWREPRAGSVAFARVLDPAGATALADGAVEHDGVMIVASPLFDFGDAHIRIGLGRRNFALAISALEGYLRRVHITR